MSLVTLKHQSASYRERSLRYQLDRRVDGPQSSSERNIEKMNRVELHLSGLIRTANHPDMQKIRIIGFFFQNKLHWQFEVVLLLFTVCTCV
jgi:hypothetical protein